MIQRAAITSWRENAPWITDAQVEQDLVLSRAIVEIFSDPTLSSALVFRGGTALHKLFLTPAARYSEDIDLVQAAPGPIGAVMDALRARLDPWLGKPKREQKEGAVRFIYRFQSEVPPVTPLRLKVEINTRGQFTVLGLFRKEFSVESPWFSGRTDVVTYAPEELFGTKLRALYQRKKGRDLFDMATALRRLPTLDAAKVVDCFTKYLAHTGKRVSRAEYEANLAAKLDVQHSRATSSRCSRRSSWSTPKTLRRKTNALPPKTSTRRRRGRLSTARSSRCCPASRGRDRSDEQPNETVGPRRARRQPSDNAGEEAEGEAPRRQKLEGSSLLSHRSCPSPRESPVPDFSLSFSS